MLDCDLRLLDDHCDGTAAIPLSILLVRWTSLSCIFRLAIRPKTKAHMERKDARPGRCADGYQARPSRWATEAVPMVRSNLRDRPCIICCGRRYSRSGEISVSLGDGDKECDTGQGCSVNVSNLWKGVRQGGRGSCLSPPIVDFEAGRFRIQQRLEDDGLCVGVRQMCECKALEPVGTSEPRWITLQEKLGIGMRLECVEWTPMETQRTVDGTDATDRMAARCDWGRINSP
jgi:hypothetical protein